MTAPNTLYITLNTGASWLPEINPPLAIFTTSPTLGVNLLISPGKSARFATRPIRNPTKLSTMVACLKIASAPSMQTMCNITSHIPLPNPHYLPHGAAQGGSRIWVKEALDQLHRKKEINLPVDVDNIEWYCKATAEQNIKAPGSPQILNDLTWLGKSPDSYESEHQAHYGSSHMVTETLRQCYELS
ncbi:hypothetical protein VFPPC_12939 [Pochonia chlamydosporia 170]|uniref:Uncharacterized protein n=1 Tax=Pochonia chlamydosporia 170 TaxID=1380566 RepID=A0A179G5S1_METCM|nr:hypothetical protein VFPPC_12939 [Pochonia chlamydosporia 170]OAQ73176.1 hypothetical protein VFPPC_12939 [Pochonia chlamydosporia 170]